MKEAYLLRHAEKRDDGVITEQGKRLASSLGEVLPHFVKVISSDSPRTKLTAYLITGGEPVVEERAGFYMATQEKSNAINMLAANKGITFFEAAYIYNDRELLKAIEDKGKDLNQLVDETLAELGENEAALIISHDMTIAPAMALRDQPRESIDYLSGYRISGDGTVTKFNS